VKRTVITDDGALVYDTPKTKGSRRRVPLTSATTALLREFVADHPCRDDPAAPLFAHVSVTAPGYGPIRYLTAEGPKPPL
jgi:integrase